MSTICQIMIMDFLRDTGRHDEETGEELYTEKNLEDGIMFMEWQQEMGRKTDLLHHFDLGAFIKWAEQKLKKQDPQLSSQG